MKIYKIKLQELVSSLQNTYGCEISFISETSNPKNYAGFLPAFYDEHCNSRILQIAVIKNETSSTPEMYQQIANFDFAETYSQGNIQDNEYLLDIMDLTFFKPLGKDNFLRMENTEGQYILVYFSKEEFEIFQENGATDAHIWFFILS